MNPLNEKCVSIGINETLCENTIKKIRFILEGMILDMLMKNQTDSNKLTWDGDYELRWWF